MHRLSDVHFAAGLFAVLGVLLAMPSPLLLAMQPKKVVGNVTEIAATRLIVEVNSVSTRFVTTPDTEMVPRRPRRGEQVTVTYVEADVQVATRVEILNADR